MEKSGSKLDDIAVVLKNVNMGWLTEEDVKEAQRLEAEKQAKLAEEKEAERLKALESSEGDDDKNKEEIVRK